MDEPFAVHWDNIALMHHGFKLSKEAFYYKSHVFIRRTTQLSQYLAAVLACKNLGPRGNFSFWSSCLIGSLSVTVTGSATNNDAVDFDMFCDSMDSLSKDLLL